MLKYRCPFHGKKWPLIAAIAAAVAAGGIAASNGWPDEVFRGLLLLAPFTALAVCYVIIQRPSAAERELITKAEFPDWVPVTADVLRCVKEQKQHIGQGTISILCYLGLFALASLLPARSSMPNAAGAAVFGFLGAAVYIADTLLRHRWQSADQSAVMAKVPIDHMFDIVHRYGRRKWELFYNIERPERTASYAVIYQPDGRYVLPVNEDAGYAKSLIIVQFNGMLTWLPCREL